VRTPRCASVRERRLRSPLVKLRGRYLCGHHGDLGARHTTAVVGDEVFTAIGGIVYPPNRLGGRSGIPWPLARITISSEGVVLAPRGVLSRVLKPRFIAFDDILSVLDWRPRPPLLPIGGALWFGCESDANNEMVFSAGLETLARVRTALESFAGRDL
jgi:hypothetical protein